MLTRTPKTITGRAKGRYHVLIEQFFNHFVQRAVVVNSELTSVQILIGVLSFHITADFNFCAAVDLRNSVLD